MALRTSGIAVMVVLFCALAAFTQAESTVVEVTPGDAWFGVYVDGAKYGSLHIAIEKKKGATAEYYSVTGKESRAFKVKDKDVTETCDYKASLGLDLKPMSYEALETKGTTKNTIKASVSAGVAEITIRFGASPANPPRKVNLTEGDCWSFCAPYLYAARKYAADKPRRYSKIVEVGCAVIGFNLGGETKKVAFQGNSTTVIEWVETESQKFTLLQGEDGSPLWWSETTKAKVTTKYISEPEEVAKSPLDYDQFQKKAKDAGKKTGKKVNAALKGTRFENALDPVGPDEESKEGNLFIRDKKLGFSIRLARGWHIGDTNSVGKDQLVSRDLDSSEDIMGLVLQIAVFKQSGDMSPERWIRDVPTVLHGSSIKGDLDMLEFDEKTAITGAEMEAKVDGTDETATFYVLAACSDERLYYISPFVVIVFPRLRDELVKYKDDMDAMMGSFRIIEAE